LDLDDFGIGELDEVLDEVLEDELECLRFAPLRRRTRWAEMIALTHARHAHHACYATVSC
jgi:hypothetical protein